MKAKSALPEWWAETAPFGPSGNGALTGRVPSGSRPDPQFAPLLDGSSSSLENSSSGPPNPVHLPHMQQFCEMSLLRLVSRSLWKNSPIMMVSEGRWIAGRVLAASRSQLVWPPAPTAPAAPKPGYQFVRSYELFAE